jgi:hypothetical protein
MEFGEKLEFQTINLDQKNSAGLEVTQKYTKMTRKGRC